MTREQAKELLPVIIAYANGETVQWREKGESTWRDNTTEWVGLSFEIVHQEFRIKPQPREFWIRGGKAFGTKFHAETFDDIYNQEIVHVKEVL